MDKEMRAAQLTAEMERTFSSEQIRSAQEQMLLDLTTTVKTLSLYTQVAATEGDLLRAGYFGATLTDMTFLLKTTKERMNDNPK